MKLLYLTVCLSMLFLARMTSCAERLVFPFMRPESQSNIVVTADWAHPKTCGLGSTNLITNTNLFSFNEQKKLEVITLIYKNVTTNSGPPGSAFKRWGVRQEKFGTWTNTFRVACFIYTNSNAQAEVRMNDPHQITVRYRTQSGDGYDTDLINGSIFAYQEYKNGILDGLFVVLHDPNNPSDQEHCGMWSRFVNGKILGKFIMWGKDGKIQNMAEFKEPFDFLKYQTLKMDLSWTEVPTGKTNSIPSSP